jgi:anaerobic ribonucleoside-triphosphate reductase activating protein
MLISKIHYPLTTLGPGTRLGIWTMGCAHACPGCIAENWWAFDQTKAVPLSDLKQLTRLHHHVNPKLGLTISGGDPFFQKELLPFLIFCKNELQIEDILVYTGFTLTEIKASTQSWRQACLAYIDVLIDGRYVEALNDNLPLRGSSNQVIHFLNPKMKSRYEPILNGTREFKVKIEGNAFQIYGIVPKNFLKNFKQSTAKIGLDIDLPV